MGEQERMVEAILFASAEPITVKQLNDRMPHGCDSAEALLRIRKRYEGRGVHVVKIGDAWAIRTAADLGFLMQKETVETRKLSRAAIETLAIICLSSTGDPRGNRGNPWGCCERAGTVDQLLELEWIKIGRRRHDARSSRHICGDRRLFLDHFGLESARDLPGLKELRAAGLLENRPAPGTEVLSEPHSDVDLQENLFDDAIEEPEDGPLY